MTKSFNKLFLALLFFTQLAFAYSYEELKKEPNSLAKDYYLDRLLQRKDKEILKDKKGLQKHIYRHSGPISKSFKKAFSHAPKVVIDSSEKKEPNPCYQKPFIKLDKNCRLYLINNDMAYIKRLDTKALELAKSTASTKDQKDFLAALKMRESKDYLTKQENGFVYMRFFGKEKDVESKDFDASLDFWLQASKHRDFSYFVRSKIVSQGFSKLKNSLLQLHSHKELDPALGLLLGVVAIKAQQREKAKDFFSHALNNFKYRSQKDNALFWLQKVETDAKLKEKLLKELASSHDPNLYSLFAQDLLGISYKKFESSLTPIKQSPDSFDIKDPIAWVATSKRYEKLDAKNKEKFLEQLFTADSLPHYLYLKKEATQHYLMPYQQFMPDTNVEKKSLILALARQESYFLPCVVSTAYALGMMQFMPFLATKMGKDLKLENFDEQDMFDPKMAFYMADIHTDELFSWLPHGYSHPLFVSYAYNGGIGFVRKMLNRGDLFIKEAKGDLKDWGKSSKLDIKELEPFLSMELVPYFESRLYGKKVMANYAIYLNILGQNARILELLTALR